MANFKYFTTCQNKQVELSRVRCIAFEQFFDVARGCHRDVSHKPYGFEGICEACGNLHVAQRQIEYKSFPSRHECSVKCMGGKANGTCECKCGGKNHGAGAFSQSSGFRAAA
jgi:hypothetical protein